MVKTQSGGTSSEFKGLHQFHTYLNSMAQYLKKIKIWNNSWKNFIIFFGVSMTHWSHKLYLCSGAAVHNTVRNAQHASALEGRIPILQMCEGLA